MKVASSSDWRDLDIHAAVGDLVAIEAEGEWKLGTYAGVCGVTGLSGDRYRAQEFLSAITRLRENDCRKLPTKNSPTMLPVFSSR